MATETTPTPAPAKKSLLVPALLGVNMLAVVGVGAFLFLKQGGGGHAAKPAEAEHGEAPEEKAEGGEEAAAGKGGTTSGVGPTVKLPDFVVRLRNPDTDRYARITFELELVSELDRERISKYLPRIRDGFISTISDLTVEELRGSEGITLLKTTLTKRIDELLPTRSVRALYISDLIVQ